VKVKKFIAKAKEYLGLHEFDIKGKRKSVTILVEKLRAKDEELRQNKGKNRDEKELHEELEIIDLHIKKAEEILTKLNKKKAIEEK